MEQNDIILDYIKSLFPDVTEKEIITILWKMAEDDLDTVLMKILNLREETSDQV